MTKSLITTGLLFTLSVVSGQIFEDQSNRLPSTSSASNMDVKALDIDKDNDLDLVFAREFQANFILINDGKGNFTNGTIGNLPQPIRDSEDVAHGDFNNDGNIDLVFCSEDDINLSIRNVHEYYWGDGKGKFTSSNIILPDSEANAVIAEDINNDLYADLIFGNKGFINILINDGTGKFTLDTNRITRIFRTTQDLILFDADGDKDKDLLAGNEDGNLFFLNNNGFFTESTSNHFDKFPNVETRKLAVADIDNDNDLDVFFANVQFIQSKIKQNLLYVNDGRGNFKNETDLRLSNFFDHTIDAIFEDVNDDKYADLVLANVFGGPIRIFINNGSGVFEDATLEILGEYYYRDALGVISSDLNGDGLKDLYFCHRDRGNKTQKDLMLFNKNTKVKVHTPTKQNINLIINGIYKSSIFIEATIDGPIQSIALFDILGNKLNSNYDTLIDSQKITVDIKSFCSSNQFLLLTIYSNNKIHNYKILLPK
ncbi:MAG: VCBS repeat-containing protein [Saprospiraceae bacterium]|nr:VCBS repeat-containing protein [Saprospiraceae bacterium]